MNKKCVILQNSKTKPTSLETQSINIYMPYTYWNRWHIRWRKIFRSNDFFRSTPEDRHCIPIFIWANVCVFLWPSCWFAYKKQIYREQMFKLAQCFQINTINLEYIIFIIFIPYIIYSIYSFKNNSNYAANNIHTIKK